MINFNNIILPKLYSPEAVMMPLGDCVLKSRYEQAFPDKLAYYDVHLAPEKSAMNRVMNRCYYIALSILSLGLLPLFSTAFREAMHWTWHHKMTLVLKPYKEFKGHAAFVQKQWFNLSGPLSAGKQPAPSKWVPTLASIPERNIPLEPYNLSVVHSKYEPSLDTIDEAEERDDELLSAPSPLRMAALPQAEEASELSSVASDDTLMSDVEDEPSALSKIMNAVRGFFSAGRPKRD